MRALEILRRPLTGVVLFYGFFLLMLILTSWDLPNQVASHFDFDGKPNGWMTRAGYQTCVAGLGLAFLLLPWAISWLLRRLPARWINLPRRDYWLSSEHRAETNVYLERRLISLACILVSYLISVHMQVAAVNALPGRRLSISVMSTFAICLLVLVALWVVELLWHFSHPPTEPTSAKR